MSITADQVKELRELTGAGMMECKKALVETKGDIDAAIELMRKSGMAKAAKKGDRTAAEGVIMIKAIADNKKAVIAEINCETDFVARDENFTHFANLVLEQMLKANTNSVNELMAQKVGAHTLEEQRLQLIAKIGEKVDVRRFDIVKTDGVLGSYVHGSRIGVLVNLAGGTVELAKDIAMHIAAAKPQVVNPEEVSAELIAKEKEIFVAQAQESGKPAEIIEKMISGRINKFLDEISLVGQPFVKDPDTKVGALLKKNNAKVTQFVCYTLGEGIEKKEVNFRDEVMAQVKGA
jgi:elongation factor Ts